MCKFWRRSYETFNEWIRAEKCYLCNIKSCTRAFITHKQISGNKYKFCSYTKCGDLITVIFLKYIVWISFRLRSFYGTHWCSEPVFGTSAGHY